MKARCCNKNTRRYRHYGGRGIAVCDRWLTSFSNFLADMGPRPSDEHSIDRIDNDGNYEPGNCRWATQKEQANNMRSNHMLKCGRYSYTITEWAKHLGVPRSRIQSRIDRGWSYWKALFKKKGNCE